MKQPTGVRRLDDLLGGGLEEDQFSLLYGTPFLGKETLARRFALAGLSQKRPTPVIMVLTTDSTSRVREKLARMDPRYAEHEKAGLIRFVDTYSTAIGGFEPDPLAEYVDGPMNLNALSLAVGNAAKKLVLEHPVHRVVVDSVSTLIAYTNAQTAFRFMQVFIGKTRMAGGLGLLLLDEGMHTDAEVQMFRHIMDGVVQVKNENAKNLVRVDGLGIQENPGWIEYRHSDTEFEVTGSFAAGRIH